ncbi:Bug family tripartite tricarboxylate transporter substrate binding protein [Aeromicrobium piscarium]|uniref:Tripartite tricarboxylate transporter substrate binding protein n=1 Tax=Aeromicrobium piscarium TaxID=2590901 RepID=A0A554SPQ3_9ACTN|nr:tripartite tricarboxylate transporter substrate binding protein [Aeromicrobium piscarium]TSD68332.1 tripartite tricarboxylate transporter substrate binding protein [Aeromicrobium piscarium]
MSAVRWAIGLVLAGLVGWFAVDEARGTGDGAQARSSLTIIAPAAAGGGWDLVAREMQQALRTDGIVGNVQVVNVPGAAGTIGLSQLARMTGDPTTIMVTGTVMVGGIGMSDSSTTLTVVTPVSRLAEDFEVIAVPSDSELETFEDVVEAWQEDPTMPIGGGSAGGIDHMIAAQLAEATGVGAGELHYTPHAGGGELTLSLLSDASGTVDVGISGYNDFRDLIDGGRLRAVAVVAPEPLEGVDAPTMIDLGYSEVDMVNWRGIVAAPGITDEERDELLDIVEEMTQTTSWDEAIERNRWEESWQGPDDFRDFLVGEQERIDAILEELGLS